MPPSPGSRIGVYEIVQAIGAGGMGEVYRARDTKLGRDVAIKILPDAFARDDERVARFEREARTLASLNHPNIAAIYGLEHSGETRALVMELVEGQTLQELVFGPGAVGLGPDDVLRIARQIADAIEAAHEQGIVHRDLKPANVIVKADGTVKVIDFGLAKALMAASAVASVDPANSPTLTAPLSERGVILGTVAYMSPEQARGLAIDKRTDIWAFGVIVYEMLTGRRAFVGEGFSDVLAAVLRREIDWGALPRDTPPRLRALLERCLESDPKRRLRDIGEARIALDAIEKGAPDVAGGAAPPTRSGGRGQQLAWGVAALAIATAVALGVAVRAGWIGGASSGATTGLTRLSVMPPTGFVLNPDSTNTAISPNGRMVAFVVGSGVSSENQLWVRAIDAVTPQRIESGDGVSLPFWSPDSTRIGFFADRKLKLVAAAGGQAQIVCDAPFARGATWNASNVIVFARDANGPLYRVPAGGGEPVAITTIDGPRETSHRFPVFLPDGQHFLFAALPATDRMYDIYAGSLDDPHVKVRIGSMESAPAYADPGWLLFTQQGVLAAQAFDAVTLRLKGDVATLGDQPRVAPGPAAYEAGRRVSASSNGSLAFIPDQSLNANLEWLDQTGRVTGSVNVPAARYLGLAVAPDDLHAVLVRKDSASSASLWGVDLDRPNAVPVATDASGEATPVWSPDSHRIVFVEIGGGHRRLVAKDVSDSSPPRVIAQLDANAWLPQSWTNGEILFNRIDPGTKWNIYRLPESGGSDPVPVIRGAAIEVGGYVSPDGHWIAYLSDEAGRLDLWLQTYPDGGSKVPVSTGGVQTAWWGLGGRELLYLKRDQTLWRVDVDLTPARAPRIGTPHQLGTFPAALVAMDAVSHGQRFLALVSERGGLDAITIVQGWKAAIHP
jgi:predicted Ser/Thr protein kinase